MIATARRMGLFETLPLLNRSLANQGELIGPGIQGNPEKLNQITFLVFDIFDIDTQKYVSPEERHALTTALGLVQVPVICANTSLQDIGCESISKILAFAEGKSWFSDNPIREGIVFKSLDGQTSFKAISNAFLLQGGD